MRKQHNRRRDTPPPQYSDVTPERLRHAADAWRMGGNERSPVRIVQMRDRPLEKLYDAGRLTAKQFHAGEKLRGYWHRAGGAGVLTSLDPSLPYTATDPAWRRGGMIEGAALIRLCEAEKAVGRIAFALTVEFTCYERGLREIAAALGRNPDGDGWDKARKLLADALDAIANLWGL